MHPSALTDVDLLNQCKVVRTKRSGPGGQHRNKVETAIVLKHLPTGITSQASERRSQTENRAVALERLRLTLAIEWRNPRLEYPDGTPLWKSRRRGTRIEVSAEHSDFPVLLAESLDHLAACNWNVGQVASRLGSTVSQLVRLWKKEPRALLLVNQQREVRGLGRLE